MNKIIFQPDETGHRREHVYHIVNFLRKHPSLYSSLLVIHPDVKEWIREKLGAVEKNVKVKALSKDELKSIRNARSLIERSIKEWDIIGKYAKEYSMSHCIHLRMNQLQIALGLNMFKNGGITFSGILFHPFYRQKVTSDRLLHRTVSWLKKKRRKISLKWALTNKQLSEVFLLNDPWLSKKLNNKIDPKRRRFSALPDPIFDENISNGDSVDIRSKYDIEESRSILLLAGTLSRRKGVIEAIKSIECLKDSELKKIHMLVIGSPTERVRSRVNRIIQNMKKNQRQSITADFRHIPEAEFQGAFESCDLVLAPYQQTRGSSGILGRAAKNCKPVLGPRSGLVGKLISDYKLGVTVEASDPHSIAGSISEFLKDNVEFSLNKVRQYVAERSPDKFARQLVSNN